MPPLCITIIPSYPSLDFNSLNYNVYSASRRVQTGTFTLNHQEKRTIRPYIFLFQWQILKIYLQRTSNRYATILAKSPWDTWQNANWWRIILKWEVTIYLPNPPPSPPEKKNVGIVGLLWINQQQHCVGGGKGRWTEIPKVGKSAKCPKTFDQDWSLRKMPD